MSPYLSAFWQVLQDVPQAFPVLRALIVCQTPFQLKLEMAETSQEHLSFWSSQFGFGWERLTEASAPDERRIRLSDMGSEHGSPLTSLSWFFQIYIQAHLALGNLELILSTSSL